MTVASVLVVLLLGSPANLISDGVGVRPDPFKPSVNIESNVWRPERGSIHHASNKTPRPNTETRPKDSACFFSNASADAPRYEPTFRCGARGTVASEPDEAAPQEEPELTEGDVRRAVSEVPMPALRVTVQPGGRTLVNVPTILHTDPRSVRESITLLGHDIDVEATPTGYTWHHGDGTSRTTTRPGRPYPAKDVTHTYQRTADQVSIRVDTTYTVRYRVDGGAWTPLGQPLTATGAATPLEVAEAAPVLVSPRR